MAHSPLRITAELAGSVASFDGRIQLDAILEHVAWRRAGRPTAEMGAPAMTFDIPLAKLQAGGLWVWRCSEGEAEWIAGDLTHYTRQFPTERARALRRNERKINVGAGPLKSYRLPLPLMLAREVVWHAVGDLDAVAEMVSCITHIGKKHNVGHGQVKRWRVEDADEDRSLIREDGSPARPLPVELAETAGLDVAGLYPQMAGHRPPYWHPDRRRLCYLPRAPRLGEEVEEWEL